MEYDSGASLYGGHSTPAGYKGGYYTACAQVSETHQQSKSRRSRSPLLVSEPAQDDQLRLGALTQTGCCAQMALTLVKYGEPNAESA